MARIYAQYENVDQAENAARLLRHRAQGIHKIQISTRGIHDISPNASQTMMFPSNSFETNSVWPMRAYNRHESPGNPAYSISGFTSDSFNEDYEPNMRKEALIKVESEDNCAEHVAHMLRNSGGLGVRIL